MPVRRRQLEDTLCQTLLECRLDFIERGERRIGEIYEAVLNLYPELCDNDYLCPHKTARTFPEWKHVVSDVVSRLKTDANVIDYCKQTKLWYFGEIIEL
jgi:hypothetical protein